jgi:hypothetical protein
MYQGFGHFLLAKEKQSQQKSRCITSSYASANFNFVISLRVS